MIRKPRKTSKIWNFEIPDCFVTSLTHKLSPKWYKMVQNYDNGPPNDGYGLKFGMEKVFVTRKPIKMLNFWNFEIPDCFMTSLIHKLSPKWYKITINGYKTPENHEFDPKVFMWRKTISKVNFHNFKTPQRYMIGHRGGSLLTKLLEIIQ